MTRSERERLIECYLNGEMSSHNEEEFFIQVALNEEMRQELKAHRTIESSIRKEREAERPEHTALRQRVAAFVVASPGPTSAAVEQPAPGAAAAAGTWQGWWWVATALFLMVVVGALLLKPGDPEGGTPAVSSTTGTTLSVPSAAARLLPEIERGYIAALQGYVVSLARGDDRLNLPDRSRTVAKYSRIARSPASESAGRRGNTRANDGGTQRSIRPSASRRPGDSIPFKIKVRIKQ